MKAIISFYTKAKAFTQLSGFYDACAQVEIDEYRDYEKALGALKEAVKYMMKAKKEDKEDALNMLQQRISLVERFVQASSQHAHEPAADPPHAAVSLPSRPRAPRSFAPCALGANHRSTPPSPPRSPTTSSPPYLRLFWTGPQDG